MWKCLPLHLWLWFVNCVAAASPNIILFVLDDFDYTSSFTESVPATSDSRDHLDINTTWINKIRNEGFIFPYSYNSGPLSSASRFSLLTSRYPSRSNYAIYRTTHGTHYDGYNGTYVDDNNSKINGSSDSIFNVPNVLQNYGGYATGLVGLYTLLNDYEIYCGDVQSTITDISNMATLYDECIDKVSQYGFDFVDGLYIDTINSSNGVFSHNPEWMVQQATQFMDESTKPFFLYFGSTLSAQPSAFDAMFDYNLSATPKGYLAGSDVPSDSGMTSRNYTNDLCINDGWKNARLDTVSLRNLQN